MDITRDSSQPQAITAAHGSQKPLLAPELKTAVAQVLSLVRAEMSAQMERVTLELRAISNDNSVLRQNLGLLNTAMADFQRLQVIPLRESLEHLRDEQGSVVIENARKLEALIQALSNTLSAAGGLIPEDLKAQIKDGRFEDLAHMRAQDQVHVDQVQAMIDAAYERGLSDARTGVTR